MSASLDAEEAARPCAHWRLWMSGRTWWVAVVAIVCVTGCKSMKTGAVESFSEKYSCPVNQITATERPDLNWVEIITSDLTRDLPVKVSVGASGSGSSGIEVIEVKGCGQHDFLGCHHPTTEFRGTGPKPHRSRTGKNLAAVSCMHHSIVESERKTTEKAEKAAKKEEKQEQKAKKKEDKALKRAEKEAERAFKQSR